MPFFRFRQKLVRASTRPSKRDRRRPPLLMEQLENRIVPTVQPVTLADPSLWGASGMKDSSHPSISADGQLIAFISSADNLAPNDTNGQPDVFVYDRGTETVTLVSVGINGQAAGVGSGIVSSGALAPVISPDGRYVAFESNKGGIISGVTGDQVYLRDLTTGTTALLSDAPNGTAGDRESWDPVFSADSHHVAFNSLADNLVTGITFPTSPTEHNLFERDLTTGATALVSISVAGKSGGDGYTDAFSLSADGRYAVFQSRAVDLAPNDADPLDPNAEVYNVFERDMQTGTTYLVSTDTAGTGGATSDSTLAPQAVSADGRYVVFTSSSTGLVAGNVSGQNVYLRDVVSGTTTLLSVLPNGNSAGQASGAIVSPDGRYVAFMSKVGLLSQDTNGSNDVYVYDTTAHALSLASVNAAGTNGGNGNSGFTTSGSNPAGGLAFSADGNSLVFESDATNLTANVLTGQENLYLRSLAAGSTTLLTPDLAGTDGSNGAPVSVPALSADGRYVAFDSTAGNLAANDDNGAADVFVRDTRAGATALASLRSPLLPASYPGETDTGSALGSVSANGRYVAFSSSVLTAYSDLAPGVTFGGGFSPSHVFVRDTQTGAIRVVGLNTEGVALEGYDPVISPDGRYVVFVGYTDLLPAGVAYGDVHDNLVYVCDLQTGITAPVSVTPDGTHDIPVTGDVEIALADTSNDLYVAFTTNAAAPIPGVANPSTDTAVFRRDVQAGTTVLVSHDTANDGQVRGNSQHISISSDGRYVLFSSTDPNLTTNDTTNYWQVYRWDSTTGRNTLVSVDSAGTGPGNQSSAAFDPPVMSADGRYIAFDSSATNLYEFNDPNHPPPESIYRVDMATSPFTVTNLGLTSSVRDNGASYAPAISADGSTVAFISYARLDPSLVYNPPIENQYYAYPNVYVSGPGGIHMISVNDQPPAQPSYGTGDAASGGFGSDGFATTEAPMLSADGRYLVFSSTATDLLPGFVGGNGGKYDVYVRDLQTGLTKLVTYDQSGTAGANGNEAGSSDHDLLSADGRTLVFDSAAPDMIIGDRNGQRDIFTTTTAGFSSISGEVFNDQNGNGSADGGEPGLQYRTVYIDTNNNGKFDPGEPSAITDATGHYSIQGLTPGAYTVTTVPQTGYVQTMPTAPLTYSVTIDTDGTAVTGENFGEERPLPDLAASNVSFSPSSGAPGQAVTVSWTVTNQGNGAAAGSWSDAVYLSPTPTLGQGAQLLTTVAHDGGLAVNGQYTLSATVAVPATLGSYHVIVQADWRNQVREGLYVTSNKTNNTAASPSALAVAVPSLTPGTPVDGQLTADSPDAYYQVTAPAGQSLVLTLASAAAGQVELFVQRGSLPTTYAHDYAATVPGQANQTLTVPVVQPGIYYILVHGVSGAAATGSVTLTAAEPGLGLQSLGQTSGGNAGQVTIPVHGTDLTANTQVSLVNGSIVLAPVSVQFVDASLLYTTFDLTGQPTGTYALHVADGSHSSTLPAAFTVQPARGPDLQVHLSVPSGIRANNPYAEVVVTYENDGDTDMPAPIFELTTDTGTVGPASGNAPAGGGFQFVGQGQDSPGGVLRAGDKGEFKFTLAVPPSIAINGGANGGGVTVTLSTLPTDTTPIDWSQFESQLQPPSIPSDAWNVVWNNFTSAVGSTYGRLQSALVSDTAYLNQIGVENPTFSQLLGFELLRADDALPTPTLAATTDASFPAPGLSLEFGRQFSQSLSGRNAMGILGLGWVSNWDISAATESDGTVLIEDAGVPRTFTPQADGSFAGLPGDHGILGEVNGSYQLRETDGTVYAFLANGQLNYVQDRNGNRITAGYTSGQMTSLTSSDGQALTLAYNGQGLLQTITDPNGQVAASYHYDGTGHLMSVTTPQGIAQDGYVTGTGTPADNALASITNPDGTQVHYTYDSQGRLTGTFDGTAVSPIDPVSLTYTSPGGVTFTDAKNHATTILYTNLGLPGEIVDALGNVTHLSYDTSGNLLGALLPGGGTYAYSYDGNGNLTSMTDPLDLTTTFTYDTHNNLASYTDAKGNKTSYGYDGDNNLLSITYANGASQSYTHNPLGEATQFLNARGDATGYTYNTQGQLATESFADGTSYSYIYDTRGNLKTATDGQGRVTTFIYGGDPDNPNNPDLLTEVDYPAGTFLKFSYYAGGLRQQSVDQTGYTVNYTYDGADRLTKLTDGSNRLIVQYTYDNAGDLIQKDNGNGTRTVYGYDPAGNALSITNYAPDHATVNSFDNYSYDPLGNVQTDTNQDGQWVYTYDADGQLIQAVFTPNNTDPDGLTAQDLQYVYDAAGNRISETINRVTTTYVVNNVNEYTSSATAGVGTTTYQYDLDGNLIAQADPSNNTTNYTFNDLNQLTGVSGPGLTASYFYDPLGNRVSQTLNGTTTNFQFDPFGLGNVVAAFGGTGVYNHSGGLLAHYTYGLGLVSQVSAGGTAGYYDFSLTGNTVGITNAAGSYVNRYSYLPFGETTTRAAALPNPFTYVGQFGVTADGGGLLGMGSRNYGSATGQFVSNDPTGLAGDDPNIRRYVGNRPTKAIDPTGLHWWDDIRDGFNQAWDSTIGAALEDAGKYWSSGIGQAQKNFNNDVMRLGKKLQKGYWSQIKPTVYQIWKDVQNIFYATPGGSTLKLFIPFLSPKDPNDLLGPAGFGAQGFLTPRQALPYTIQFENDPTKANAAAQDVTVTQQLDPNLDWTTFQLGNIQIGSTTIAVPNGLQSYSMTYNTTNIDGTPLQVDVSASLDQLTGLVTWTFRSLDPTTGLTPLDPVAGFLPVDDDTGRGQASVTYTVQPKADLTTGDSFSAQAAVVFDTNAPLDTAVVRNTIDSTSPTSSVDPLPATTAAPFTVSWSGSDGAGSGIASYTVYVSADGGRFTAWLTNTDQTSASYSGAAGHTYSFYSVATDNVGLAQPTPAGAQASTMVVPPIVPPPPPPPPPPASIPNLVGYPDVAAGADAGGPATVTEYNPDGSIAATFDPFPGTTGGVRTAVGDFNGDGVPDVAAGTGPGAVAEVKILDGKTGAVLFDVQPFADFTGGVFVAAGTISGPGTPADLVITPDLSGGPRVEIYEGGDFQEIANFFGIDDPNFRGGARAAAGDINADGYADLVVSAGFGGGPRVSVFDGKALAQGRQVHLVPDFFLFEPALRNGAYVAVGDVNGDGLADIIGGGGPGGGPRVLVISGKTLLSSGATAAITAPVANFFAGDVNNRGGIRVTAKNLDGDAHADVVVGDGTGAGSTVTAYLGKNLAAGDDTAELSFDAFAGSAAGVYVG